MNGSVPRIGAWLAIATLAIAGCSSGGSSGGPEERVVVAEGTTLRLLRLDGQKLVQVDAATLPADGLLASHTIFGIMQHPTRPWLYVTSFNECGMGDIACWGNARIDRFTVSKGSISHAGRVFAYDTTTTLACANEPSDYEGQVGWCAPVNGGFSADGTRLYVKEDDNDNFAIFTVGADGGLTFVMESAPSTVDLHGMAAHPTEAYVYNGINVLGVANDEGSVALAGQGGNDTVVVDRDGADDLLVTTLANSTVGVYTLADPAAPALVSSATVGSNRARAVAFTDDLSRLVTVGRSWVATYAFDGALVSAEDALDLSGGAGVENRGVALVDGGSHAVVSWFVLTNASPSGVLGGVTLYAIDPATGALASVHTTGYLNGARVVKALTVN